MNNNISTVNSIYDAFGKGNIQAIIASLADDVQWEPWADNSAQKSGVPWLQPRGGKEGAFEFFRIVGEFSISDFRVLSVMSNDNQVTAEVVIEAVIPTGGHYRDEEMHLWTFDEQGKVIRMRHYTDTAKHMAAAPGNSN